MSNNKWNDFQEINKRQILIKEKIQQWKKQRENILSVTSSDNTVELKKKLAKILTEKSSSFPIDFKKIVELTSSFADKQSIKEILLEFSLRKLIELNEYFPGDSEKTFFILSINYDALSKESFDIIEEENQLQPSCKNETKESTADISRYSDDNNSSIEKSNHKKLRKNDSSAKDSVEGILSLQSIKEKENKKISEEILKLLSKPTAKELSLNEQFRSANGQVQEFCPHGTKEECVRNRNESCSKLHFLKIIQKHTDESLGDCSFLNTCFHMDSCKYVHYKVEIRNPQSKMYKDDSIFLNNSTNNNILVKTLANATEQPFKRVLFPPQWIRCDLRFFDMSILGKFAVVMADPPWDIHMELPYGTMSDDEMRNLNIPCLQDEGLIFLWVTGRAMELGRECLKLWGYERCDELIWVKTNQLQRIIRTGRTGHWINHGKEHCLVGVKGKMKNINRSLDCDVIVAEVRATSHKPDEIYGIIERLSPGTRKIELFGRQHNTQPNWVTLGNQLSGVKLVDPQLIEAYKKCYPDQAHLI